VLYSLFCSVSYSVYFYFFFAFFVIGYVFNQCVSDAWQFTHVGATRTIGYCNICLGAFSIYWRIPVFCSYGIL
jgi:hypothetical protein